MTAIRDRASDSEADEVALPWDARPIFGARRGLPWWGALLLAFGLALVGAAVDMKMHNALAWVFRVCYFVGSVGAICFVRRRNLFGPMVQPPLIIAVTVPGVVVGVSGFPANADTLTKALTVGTPLINGFPAMAVTTGCTLAVGIYRLYRERDPEVSAKSGDPDKQGDPKRPAKPARPVEEGRPRPGQPGRGGAGRGQRPPEGRGGGRPRPTGENALPPPGRRPPPDEAPRRGDPGGRGGKTPPPGGRRPRGPVPDDAPRRRSGGAGGDRPRRQPPRPGDPRGPQGGDPRRGSGRNGPPPRRRPWDDDV